MTDTTPRRKLAAILAADVVGLSLKMGENEDRTLKNLKACSVEWHPKLSHFEENLHPNLRHPNRSSY